MSEIIMNNNISTPECINSPSLISELEFFKKKCDVLEKDLFKSQTQNKKNDLTIKKLQDMVALYGKNTNNTSNTFLLPSEFKTNWENMVKDSIMEAFDNIFDDCVLLSHLVQDTIRIIYEQGQKLIKDKIMIILKSLGIEIADNEYEKFLLKFRLLFQEYFSVIFNCTDEFTKKVIQELEKAVNEEYSEKVKGDRLGDIKRDLDSKGLNMFISCAFRLCIYMLLHDPPLSFNIQKYEKRNLSYFFYNKSDFMNIEGFAKENSPCLVILPYPLLRSNFAYQGLKPAVYIVSKVTEVIKDECEKNKPAPQKARSYSSSDFNGVLANKETDKGGEINSQEQKEKAELNTSYIGISHNSNYTAENKNNEHSQILKSPQVKPNIGVMKPNSADFTISSSNSSNKSPLIHSQISNITVSAGKQLNINNSVNPPPNTSLPSECASYREKQTSNTNNLNNNKKPYDHPLNMNSKKNSTQENDQKESYKEIHFRDAASNKQEKYHLVQERDTSPHLLDHLKNYRSNSHNNVKNPSRNSSALESFNNSMNKDSVRTNEGLYQKSSRTHKNNTPRDNSDIDSAREREIILTEKLNNISNSFTLIRAKAGNQGINNQNNKQDNLINSNQNNNISTTNTNTNPSVTSKNSSENIIRLNLNSNVKKYNLNNMNLNAFPGNLGNMREKDVNRDNEKREYKENENQINQNKVNNSNMNVNINYPLNTGAKSKNPSSIINSTNKISPTPGNYLKNINNNLNINNMMLKTNYEFGNLTRKKNLGDLEKYTTKQTSEPDNLTNNFLNRNNSQSNDLRLDQQNTNQNSNVIINSKNENQNYTQKSKTMKAGAFAGLKLENSGTANYFNNNIINLQSTGNNFNVSNSSPKAGGFIPNTANKVKATTENFKAYLEYGGSSKKEIASNGSNINNVFKDNLSQNSQSNNSHTPISNSNAYPQSRVYFNGDYEYFNHNQTNTTPNVGYKFTHNSTNQINTDGNFIHPSKHSNDFNNEGGSSSNRLPTGGNYEYSHTHSHLKDYDMKFNGPKRDDFALKLGLNSKKEKDNVLNNKIPDVQFNVSTSNFNNYIVNKEENLGGFANMASQKSTELNKNKIDKHYSKLVGEKGLSTGGSPKNIEGGHKPRDNTSTLSGGSGMNSTNLNSNTYTSTYKEKIMKNSGTTPSNIQIFNAVNTLTFQKNKK